MFLNQQISKVSSARFAPPRDKVKSPRESYELGAAELYDTDTPFKYTWYCYIKSNVVYLEREGKPPVQVLTLTGEITEIDFTFDQSMRPTICYIQDGVTKLNYYDATLSDMTTRVFPNTSNPRLSLDDKRKFNIANSDVIFAYIKDNNLYYRVQRERYDIEHLVEVDRDRFTGEILLEKIGMDINNRFNFSVGFKVFNEPSGAAQPQNARLAYPEAAWISYCGDKFPSEVQWLHKYLAKVDVVPKKALPRLDSNITTTASVFKDAATAGSATTQQGLLIHEQVSLDWVKWAIGRKVWKLLYSKGRVTRVDGITLILNEVKDVLNFAVEQEIFTEYEVTQSEIDATGEIISIKFTAKTSHNILYVDISGSLTN